MMIRYMHTITNERNIMIKMIMIIVIISIRMVTTMTISSLS